MSSPSDGPDHRPMSDLAVLQRWEDAGGVWRVLDRRPDGVTIALCRCDGGEEVDRLRSDDPELLTHLADRATEDR